MKKKTGKGVYTMIHYDANSNVLKIMCFCSLILLAMLCYFLPFVCCPFVFKFFVPIITILLSCIVIVVDVIVIGWIYHLNAKPYFMQLYFFYSTPQIAQFVSLKVMQSTCKLDLNLPSWKLFKFTAFVYLFKYWGISLFFTLLNVI